MHILGNSSTWTWFLWINFREIWCELGVGVGMREIWCSFGVIDQLPISADAENSLKIDNSTWAICVPATPDPAKNSRPAARAKLPRGRNPRWGDANVPSFKRSFPSILHMTKKITRWKEQYYWVTISALGCLMRAAHQQPHVLRHWGKVENQA